MPAHDGGNRFELGQARGAPASLAGDQLVAPAGQRPDQDGLEHPARLDRPGQGHQRFLVEGMPRLVGARVDHVDRDRAKLLELIAGRHGQDRG